MKNYINHSILLIASLCVSLNGSADMELIEPELIKEDIRFLKDRINRIHPTLSSSNYSDQLQSYCEDLTNPISKIDFYRAIQPIISIDGHTTVIFSGIINPNIRNSFIPFEVVINEGRIYVKKNHSNNPDLKKGTEILKIRDIPSSEILDRILKMKPGERSEYKLSRLTGKGFPNFYKLTFGEFEKYVITISTEAGPKELVLDGVKNKVFNRTKEPMLSYKKLDTFIGLLRIRAFRNPTEFKANIDQTFEQVSQDEIKNLIIDVRGGGGMSDMADYLISYLTTNPYKQYSKKITKISDETASWIESKNGAGFSNGAYFIYEPQFKDPAQHENQFNGQIYIITGPEAYSTMTLFVAMAKEYTNAIIVGEETGQPLISNGDISRHQLPNSNLNFYLSHSTYYMPGANNDTHGVIPDIPVYPTLKDLINDVDVRLDKTLALIQAKQLQ